MIDSLIDLSNARVGNKTTSTVQFKSHNKILLVMSWTETMTS